MDADILTDDLGAAVNFRLEDFFGEIVPALYIDSLDLNSVFDNQEQPADRTDWFYLHPVGDFWNIRTTSNFVNEAWYRDANGGNTFKFNFTAVVTEPGKSPSTTIIEEVGSLINIDPKIYKNDGTDVIGGTITLPQTSPLTNELVIVKARNGANIPNAERDLFWAIKSAVDSSGKTVSYFSISQAEDTANHYKKCTLYNNKIQSSDLIPVDTYTIVLEVEDAAASKEQVTIEVQIGTQPNQIRYKYWGPNEAADQGSRQAMQIHITDSGSLNGYYLWKGTEEQWRVMLEAAMQNSGLVEIQNTLAFKSTDTYPNNRNCANNWIYSPDESLAQGLYQVCAGDVYEFGGLVTSSCGSSNSMQWWWDWHAHNPYCYPGGGTTSFGYRIIKMDQVGAPTSGGTVIKLDNATNSTIGLVTGGVAPAIGFIVTGDGIPNNTRIETIAIVGGYYQITLSNTVTSTAGTTITLSPYVGTITSGGGVTRTISYYIT